MVDYDVSALKFSTKVLGHQGYKVDTAEDGAAAWEILGTGKYDLLITDNNMPKVTGVELLKKLHASGMAVPAILATGALPEEEFARNPEIKPAATLLKPYTLAEFLRTVKRVLHGREDSPPPNSYGHTAAEEPGTMSFEF